MQTTMARRNKFCILFYRICFIMEDFTIQVAGDLTLAASVY